MYLVSVLMALFLGGMFAMLIRTQLLDPSGMLFHKTEILKDSLVYKPYNQIFTLHGAIMIFLVLIPGIPAVLGNFVLPLMLGAKDVAFPRLNLWSYYFYVGGTLLFLASIVVGAVDTGWTFYTPYSTQTPTAVICVVFGCLPAGVQLDFHGHEFHRHHPQAAAAGHDLVPLAAVLLGPVRHGGDPDPGHARAGDYGAAADHGAAVSPGIFDPAYGGDAGPLPALLLVLFAPGRVHHDLARPWAS